MRLLLSTLETLDDLFPAPGEPVPPALPADRFGPAVQVHEQDRKLCLGRRVLKPTDLCVIPFLGILGSFAAARGTPWPNCSREVRKIRHLFLLY